MQILQRAVSTKSTTGRYISDSHESIAPEQAHDETYPLFMQQEKPPVFPDGTALPRANLEILLWKVRSDDAPVRKLATS